jgi:putrescine aminotransferase
VTQFWHPFADMSVVSSGEFVVERGEDVWIFDRDGRRYLDASASLWYANVGHGRAEIADAVRAQMAQLEAYSAFGDFANEPALRLTERLSSLAPIGDARVFLTTGGGDAIETAAKLARQYWAAKGKPHRAHLLSREAGYHGTNGFGTSLGGIESNRAGFGPLVASTSTVPYNSLEALEEKIHELGPECVAAFFCEPVIGAGGVLPPPDGYMEGAAALCAETGVLFVVDSVICGFGRLGSWFGIERWSIEPDMITFAKGVTSGYLPLGGVIISPEVAEPFWSETAWPLRHGATYAGHASCCAAGLANLDILERENLIPRGAELERPLLEALTPLADHPLISEVRGGVGMMAALEVHPDARRRGVSSDQIAEALREKGTIARPLLGRSIAYSPPLTITDEHLAHITKTTQEALDAILEGEKGTSRSAAQPAL